MDNKQRKQLLKRRDGLLKDIKTHEMKRVTEKGEKDTTPMYWEKEIEIKKRIVEGINKRLERK